MPVDMGHREAFVVASEAAGIARRLTARGIVVADRHSGTVVGSVGG